MSFPPFLNIFSVIERGVVAFALPPSNLIGGGAPSAPHFRSHWYLPLNEDTRSISLGAKGPKSGLSSHFVLKL